LPVDLSVAIDDLINVSTCDVGVESAIDINGKDKGAIFSKLKFVNVELSDVENRVKVSVAGIYDTACEVSCVKLSVLNGLSSIERVGKVKLRGIIGEALEADVVRLYVNLENCVDRIAFVCAVSDAINDDLILASDVVDKLWTARDKVCDIATRAKNYDVNSGNDQMNNVDQIDEIDMDTVNNVNNDAMLNELSNDSVEVDNESGVYVDKNDNTDFTERGKIARDCLIKEQQDDNTLQSCWKLAHERRSGFRVDNGILVHDEKILGQNFTQLCLPSSRIDHVMSIAHDVCGAHLGTAKTVERVKLSFYFPNMRNIINDYVASCEICQRKARVTRRDRVPIQAIPRADRAFDLWFADLLGPLWSDPNIKPKYNFCLIMCDSATRFPVAIPLRSTTAKSVCEAMLQVFFQFGVSSSIVMDNAPNLAGELTQCFLKKIGCAPRLVTPYHPEGNALAERAVQNIKRCIGKVAADHPRNWNEYIGYILWALREVPNETTGVPPWVLAFGHLPRGPLAILKESYCGERVEPVDLGRSTEQYLQELHKKLEIARGYADVHTKAAQQRYVAYYNLKSRDKHFTVGDKVLILQPDSTTSRVFSKWKGPATVVEVKSPYSYLVELNDARYLLHANKLRKFVVRVDEACVSHVHITDVNCDLLNCDAKVQMCTLINDSDTDFGDIATLPDNDMSNANESYRVMPSEKIDKQPLSHLSDDQQSELLKVLNKYPSVFSDVPGYTDVSLHEIHVDKDFVPKRFKAYRIPDQLKSEVDRQIEMMLELGLIRKSKSPMASPVICVLKGRNACDGVRIVVDYRYLNKYSRGDALSPINMMDVIKKLAILNTSVLLTPQRGTGRPVYGLIING
jgi:hypothetical protein